MVSGSAVGVNIAVKSTMRKIANLLPPKKNYTSEMQPASPLVNKILYTISAFDANHLKNNKLMGVTCVSHGKIIK
jgi:hypothetical protein